MRSFGKGITEESALASAYAEIIERLSAGLGSGLDLGPYRLFSGYKGNSISDAIAFKYLDGYVWSHQNNDYLGKNVIGVESLLRMMNFTAGQYDFVKMHSELLRHWVNGYSISKEDEVKLPLSLVKWISATNGLASGNTIGEAIMHGFCEIMERSALISALRNEANAGKVVDLSTIEYDSVQNTISDMKARGIEPVIRDISVSNLPVFMLVTYNKKLEGKIGYNIVKAGASFNSEEALTRCFTERSQGYSDHDEGEYIDLIPEMEDGPFMITFFKGACPVKLDHLKEGEKTVYKKSESWDIEEEIGWAKNIVGSLNSELIFVDHTHPVMNFPSVRVIIPGYSDFISWWNQERVTLKLLTNLTIEDEEFEENLISFLKTFKKKKEKKKK